MAPRARIHPELLSLASGSWVSLLPRREDMQIPLRVSCQDFFWDVPNYSLGICRRSWTVFILHCYFGESCCLLPFFPLFFFLIFIVWNPETLHGWGKADKHPSSCPGKGSGGRSGFPGEAPVLYCHRGRTESTEEEEWEQLWASHIHDLFATAMLLGLFSAL